MSAQKSAVGAPASSVKEASPRTTWFDRVVYRNYRVSSSFKYWFERRFSTAGLMVVLGALTAAGIGLDTNQAMAYQVFSILFCLMIASLLWTLAPKRPIEVERIMPKHGTAGTILPLRYRIRNPNRRMLQGLSLIDTVADTRPTLAEFVGTPEPGERERNWFDRHFRFYRWRWLILGRTFALLSEKPLPPLAANSTMVVDHQLMPRKRGVLRLRGLLVVWPDAFGLFRSFKQLDLTGSLLILPKRYVLPEVDLPGQREHQPGGVNLAGGVGESEEFVSLRDYRRGDPLRHIHWKSVSKTGKLVVKEYIDEFFVRHALVLDTFLEKPDEQIFEEAISLAASFVCTVQRQEALLDLMFVGPRAYTFTAGRGVGQTEHILEVLASVEPCTTRPFSELSNLVLRHAERVSGSICILLRWDEQRRALVRQLQMRRLPCLVYLVCSAEQAEGLRAETRNLGIKVVRAGIIQADLQAAPTTLAVAESTEMEAA